MAKPEWGTKRSCPKCGERFYDLGEDNPVTCIACGINWEPEPVLKSKQPLPFDTAKTTKEKAAEVEDLDEEDLDIDEDDEGNPDDETDLGGDDDLSEVTKSAEGGEEV